MSIISQDTQRLFLYDAHKKSELSAFILLASMGWLGAHRFYLGKKTSALVMVFITLVGLIAHANDADAIFGTAAITIAVWLLIDITMIPAAIRRHNDVLGVNLRQHDLKRALATASDPSIGGRFVRSAQLLPESTVGMVGVGICLFWILVALLAPLLAPLDPLESIEPLALPGTETEKGTLWLGADFLGRDVLSRIIHGSRTVLIWAPLATAAAYAVGIVLGLTGGYFGGRVDDLISFLANLILSFPVLVIFILLISFLGGTSGATIVIAVTFASAPAIFRIVRGEVLSIRNRDFIAAAKTRGESVLYILFSEILPNAKNPLIVDACLRMGYTTITIGILGFLGLGFPPPNPDWGGMINENRAMALIFPHMTVFPCLAISSFVLGLNLLADGIREISQRQ